MTGTAPARVPGPLVPGPGDAAPVSRLRRVLTTPLVAALAAVAALVGGTWLGVARTVEYTCVHLDGALAGVGLRLSLVQDVVDCPTGTLALAPAPSQGVVLAAGLLLPVLAACSALGALAATLAAVLLRAVRTAREVLVAVVRHLPRPVVAAPGRTTPDLPAWSAGHPWSAALARALHPHRGPPVALA